MNPPSAIHSAMGRERKPFTYTPGGLDLSEIKSERMAKRLMRNAMNQGVPELPQTVNSPPTPSTPIAVPNFNCLPVQVFPSFQLPANPKSLLRTRSTPDQPRGAPQGAPPLVNSVKSSGVTQLRENTNNTRTVNNNNCSVRPDSMFEYSQTGGNENTVSRTNYGSDAYTKPLLPEICYDAEYFEVRSAPRDNFESISKIALVSKAHKLNAPVVKILENASTGLEFTIQPMPETPIEPAPVIKPIDDNARTDDDEQVDLKLLVVKKQVKTEQKVESETKTGEQNGDTNNVEAEMTVKLPAKKSEAKTETKVDVVKRTLPDGSEEEVTTTTTKTTKDGRTEISTRTQTKITPKQVDEVDEEEEEEDEEDANEVTQSIETKEPITVVVENKVQEKPSENIVKREERSKTTTTKRVVVVQKAKEQVEDPRIQGEEEEEEEEEEVVEVVKPVEEPAQKPQAVEDSEEEEQEEVVEVKKEVSKESVVDKDVAKEVKKEEEKETEVEKKEVKEEILNKKETAKDGDEDEDEYEEEEEEQKPLPKPEKETEREIKSEPTKDTKKDEDEESEYTEEEYESEKEESKAVPQDSVKPAEPEDKPKQEEKKEAIQPPVLEQRVPLREPSIPLEKVEDVEIKPIGASSETVSKSHSESTEIIRSNDKPSGGLSTKTEFNRIENIVTVNRTTKTLDRSYEQLTQQGIPTVKTYFAPDRERVSTSPQPSRPYQSAYTPQSQPERRHSLLLERLSTERQMPSDLYQSQYNNQSYEQQRWSQEPQSEVVNVSNVKPSSITNQQWYQQNRNDNAIYNNVESSLAPSVHQQWSQPQIPPSQPQNLYQTLNSDNVSQDTVKYTTNDYQQNSYTSYAHPTNNWTSNKVEGITPSYNAQPTQYSSHQNKDSLESYQKTQQYSSSYVPPPWEQDSHYIAPELPSHNYYQAPPSTNTFSTTSNQGWKPMPPAAKYTKPISSSYVPPAPNQSFVMTNLPPEMPKIPGRKTYYSEYERRYITVPESTYIPSETKYQPQPDPSSQYYYDKNEPSETVEHQWRKELREFTEKSSQPQQFQPQQQTQTEPQSSVRPPWEQETKYGKTPSYTPQPSWSQTLRPQSWRERSFESEFVENKTSTLGRGRPLSSYGSGNIETIPERPRGVSVDRYNPNNYQTPGVMEHGPVPTHTLNPPTKPFAKGYHNPNVPAYHSRPSAEPREHPTAIPQARWGDSRESPIQSRSFKYLQWITGTEN